MRFFKRVLLSTLTTAAMVFLLLPSVVAIASATTFEVNFGQGITLYTNETITAGPDTGIPVTVRNLPAFEEGKGFGGFRIHIVWDKNMLNLDSVMLSLDAYNGGWNLVNDIDQSTGVLDLVGYSTTYVRDDITLCYLGITATGDSGKASTISVHIDEMVDDKANTIPVSSVNAIVRISGQKYLEVTPADYSFNVGDTVQFKAELVDENNTRQDVTDQVTWITGSESIVTVEQAGDANPGLVTGVGAGVALIRAHYDYITFTTTITVLEIEEEEPEEIIEETVEPETEIEEPVEPEQVEPEQVEPEPELIDETPAEEPETTDTKETTDTADQPETTEVVDPGTATDDDADSGLPIVWIIGGVAVFVAVIGALGYTLFIRGRY